MLFKELTIILIVSIFVSSCSGQGDFSSSEKVVISSPIKHPAQEKLSVVVGAEQTDLYLPLLLNKKVGIVANHTSMINTVHLVDSLLKLKISIKKVFSPEHGFRGNADAGEKVKSNVDAKTKLPIISLYGKNKKPTPEQLKGLEVIILIFRMLVHDFTPIFLPCIMLWKLVRKTISNLLCWTDQIQTEIMWTDQF